MTTTKNAASVVYHRTGKSFIGFFETQHIMTAAVSQPPSLAHHSIPYSCKSTICCLFFLLHLLCVVFSVLGAYLFYSLFSILFLSIFQINYDYLKWLLCVAYCGVFCVLLACKLRHEMVNKPFIRRILTLNSYFLVAELDYYIGIILVG